MELVVPFLVYIIAILAIVSGLGLVIWWIIGLYWMHSRGKEHELQEVTVPANIKEKFTGIPLVLIILMIFTGITMVTYVLTVWQTGVSY